MGRWGPTRMGVGEVQRRWYHPEDFTYRWAGWPDGPAPPSRHTHGGQTMPRGKNQGVGTVATSRHRRIGGSRAFVARLGVCMLRTRRVQGPGLVLIALRPWWSISRPGQTVGYALFQTSRAARTGSGAGTTARGRGTTSTTGRTRTRRRTRLGRVFRGNYVLWMRVR